MKMQQVKKFEESLKKIEIDIRYCVDRLTSLGFEKSKDYNIRDGKICFVPESLAGLLTLAEKGK